MAADRSFPFFIYGPNLPIWWIGDDTQILKHAASHHFWEYFLAPSVWQELSANNLTPWIDAIYDLDLFLFTQIFPLSLILNKLCIRYMPPWFQHFLLPVPHTMICSVLRRTD